MTIRPVPNDCAASAETAEMVTWRGTINRFEREIEVTRAKPNGLYVPTARIRHGDEEYLESGPPCPSLDAAVRAAVAMVGPATIRSGWENSLSYE